MRNWLFRTLFRAEYNRQQRLEAECERLTKRNLEITETWRPVRPWSPARITIEPAMADQAIDDALAGTDKTEPVKAIVAMMSSAIVSLSDRATDAPRPTLETRDGIIVGFSENERLHVAGQVSGIAEMLREIQQRTKARPQP